MPELPPALWSIACSVYRKKSVSSPLDTSHSFLSALGHFLKSSFAALVHINSILFPAGQNQERFAEAKLQESVVRTVGSRGNDIKGLFPGVCR